MRIYDRFGNLLSEDDDSGPGYFSLSGFYAHLSGDYYVEAASFNDGLVGSYQATLSDVTSTIASMDTIANELTTGYWTSSGSTPHHFAVTQGDTLTFNVVNLTTDGQTLARAALLRWTEATGVIFQETTGTAAITFEDSQTGTYSNSVWSGDVTSSSTVNISTQWLVDNGTGFDSYSFQTYIHEIGHALGLGHAGDYNGNAVYPTDALFNNDSWQASVMSYFDPLENTVVDGSRAFVVSPMIADLIAIQTLYGAPTNTRTGDTIYGFNSNAGALFDAAQYPSVQYTIYDSGGIDTLDYSGFSQSQTIDLRAEALSNVGGLRGNVGIARGVVIGNAIGGSGGDTLIGNAAANSLNGGGGVDVMVGGAGNDTYIVNVAGDIVVESAGQGNDHVRAGCSYTLAAGQEIERLSAFDPVAVRAQTLTGNEYGQWIYGGAGANVIDGRGGADRMYGLGGDDIYLVDNAGDIVFEAAGGGTDFVRASVSYVLRAGQEIERLSVLDASSVAAINLTGNEFAQTLLGSAGANVLNGGAGADLMIGMGGNDTYIVDDAADLVSEGAGGGYDHVRAIGGYTLRAGQEIERLSAFDPAATATVSLFGNEFAQTIVGSAGVDIIAGGLGADVLTGLGGGDRFLFNSALGADNIDRITDFAVGQDRIALDDAIFTALSPGALSAGAFALGAGATDALDRIIYNPANGALVYDADGAGGAAGQRFATLSAGLALTRADFVVV